MRRFTTWAVLAVLVGALIMSVGCQQAEEPMEQVEEMTDDAGAMVEDATETAGEMVE